MVKLNDKWLTSLKVAVTGHRPDKLGNEYSMNGEISTKIYNKLSETIDRINPDVMISGMALGVDMIFANLAINRKIPLIAAIPFKGQEGKWPDSSQRIYNKMLGYAQEQYVICSGGYSSYKMQKRNEWMVDSCDILIAVWNGSEGGTFNCINYAIEKDKLITRINPKEL